MLGSPGMLDVKFEGVSSCWGICGKLKHGLVRAYGAVTILIDVVYSLDYFEGLDDVCSSSAICKCWKLQSS